MDKTIIATLFFTIAPALAIVYLFVSARGGKK